nr:MAG TPA: hypothetical protein [Bacteriophage sp.]DAR10800.1 MAG TPA: hypothetical protein [Caudoviricetes sp.]
MAGASITSPAVRLLRRPCSALLSFVHSFDSCSKHITFHFKFQPKFIGG